MSRKSFLKLLSRESAREATRESSWAKGSVLGSALVSLLLACVLALGGCSGAANNENDPTAGGQGAQAEQAAGADESGAPQDSGDSGGIQLQFSSDGDQESSSSPNLTTGADLLASAPDYDGKAWVEVNGNVPSFTQDEIAAARQRGSYERFSELDSLGRCGVAEANVGRDIMPTEKRGRISSVKPTGWHSVKYDGIDGGSLYNRCHLIAHQLTGQNANWKNLITGTRYLNIEGMLPFEEEAGDYVRATGNHVLYRVTPLFSDDEAVARGVWMEAYSIEDGGAGVCFSVYCYNVQPGIGIDYATGDSWRL